VRRTAEPLDLAPKKLPSQQRSRATFDALVEACAGLLAERGYAAASTNRIAERAGVNVASLYEYFPGKDAIVAQVAERMVERVLGRIAAGVPHVLGRGGRGSVQRWIELIHDTVARERKLVATFVNEIPYTNQLAPIQAIGARLLELSQQVRAQTGGMLRADFGDASLLLLINLVTSTIMQSVLEPPQEVSRRALLDELVRRVEEWILR